MIAPSADQGKSASFPVPELLQQNLGMNGPGTGKILNRFVLRHMCAQGCDVDASRIPQPPRGI